MLIYYNFQEKFQKYYELCKVKDVTISTSLTGNDKSKLSNYRK